MTSDLLTSALIRSMARDFSVAELIRTAETLKGSGQGPAVENLYAAWVQYNKEHPLLYAVLFNYSVVLSEVGKLASARECLERAIEVNAEFIPAYINLGRIYERMGNVSLALVQWSAAQARLARVNGPAIAHKAAALNQSARALEAMSQDDAAENMLRQSLELDPHQREVVQHLIALRQRQCEWPVILPSERVERPALLRGMSPLSAAALTDDPLFHLALAAHYNESDVGTPSGACTDWPSASASGTRLRVGYLSSDLREHAVGYLLTEVFGLHDRAAVEVFAYYCGPASQDSLHAHFRDAVDHFVPIGHMDDEAAARRMVEDGIQILVDLNGYTRDARLKLVAMRPAPVIVNWLGFPGTMGSPYHQYLIADDWIVPASHELYYSERVLRLPCYQPSSRTRKVAPAAPARREVGLPEKGTVYCCFNGAHKITRCTFDRWLMILARVPGSVLWLLGSTQVTHERLRAYAAGRGIAPERIVFADKLTNPFHLARYPLADLFLDTTPYGAHTTSSDALWMGVPVLTYSGRSFASRVCGSLTRAAGLPELACTSAEQFVERAVGLGSDPATLARLRAHLRDVHDSCVLFDTPLLVRHLEELYRQVWREFQAGEAPRPDLGNLPAYLEVGIEPDHEEVEVQVLRDYHAWWLERLAQRHKFRAVGRDPRLVALAPGLFA